jgi:hypothetical protein
MKHLSKNYRLVYGLLFLLSLLVAPGFVSAERGLNVAVIAHSISTSREAREIRRRNGWTETDLRQADAILVVCRSSLNWPLDSSYDSINELDDDADSQLNISGSNFHIYICRINNDLSVDEIKHVNYPAED